MPAVIWQLAKNFSSQTGYSLDINTNQNLGIFYLGIAIFLLIVAIIVYPTIRDRNKKKK